MQADHNRSGLILEVTEKVMELDPPNIGWLTAEAAEKLLAAFSGAHTYLFMQLLKDQVPIEEAREHAGMQAPLLMFQLGMQVGAELEAGRAMREMFGE